MRSYRLLPVTVTFFLSVLLLPSQAQQVPEPVTNVPLYAFIDELAVDGIIDLNGAVKPYGRKIILAFLEEASEAKDNLTIRQQKELIFYLADFGEKTKEGKMRLVYNPATAQYHDSLFSLTVSPLLGMRYGTDGAVTWENGAKVYGGYGSWGFFAALQDNHQDPLMGKPEYLTRERGGHIKNGTDFSEMTAGISYAWKWGDISFVKDAPVWGSGYAGTNILSGRAPSFIQVRLHVKPVKWLEMTWLHGWLNSMVVDSTRSFWVTNAYGTDYREVYRRKYIAANLVTITPFDRLHISAGNSVVYADARLMPNYLMPFYFYKSVDHAVNSGIDNSNSQMFLDISSYNIRHLHLYGTLFIDELSTSRFGTSDYNFFSWKGGFRAGNFSFLPNLWMTAECTFTYPLTFQHNVPVLTFENQGYNLGHYLRDNSRSFYFALDYKPVRAMNIRLWHEWAERGTDYQSIGGPRVGLSYINPVEWKSVTTGFEVNYMITGGVSVNVALIKSNVDGEEGWIAPGLYGSHTSFSGTVVWGF
ncbi:MAG TPA: hypothetical protein VMV74_08130 [Bacteroidales bacterium]|nr:hypothetical protein [Bacteroidales bacterium]